MMKLPQALHTIRSMHHSMQAVAALLLLLTGLAHPANAQDNNTPAFTLPLQLDCGPKDQKLADGFIALTGKDVYTPQQGYGWLKPWGFETNASQHDDPRFGDSITAREHIDTQPEQNNVNFRVDVPNGIYAVTVWVGDPSPTEGRRGICAAINERVVLPAPGVGGWGTVTERKLPAIVDDGVLNLNLFITGKGGSARLAVLALRIERVEDQQQQQVIRKQWNNAAGADEPEREMIIDGKVVKEAGRQREPKNVKLPADWPVKNYVTFTRSSPGKIMSYSLPYPKEMTQKITGFASPGEDHPMWFGVHALEDLSDVRVAVSDLASDAGVIASHEVELFTLTTRPRTLSDRPGQVGKLMTDLMDKHFPFDVKAGSTQPLYLRVHVPTATPAGTYTGLVTLTPRDAKPLVVKVSLRVLPIALEKPEGKVWHLFSDTARWNTMSDEARRVEINDMARHGINSMVIGHPPTGASYIEKNGRIVDADYGVVGEGLAEAKTAGMTGPMFIGSTAGVVFRLHGWSAGHRGNASHHFIDVQDNSANGTNKAVVIEHQDKAALTEMGSVGGTIFKPKQAIRLEVRYRTQGSISASIALQFMKNYKRDPVTDGRVTSPLAASEEWRTISVNSHVPDDAIYAVAKFNVGNGPGKIIIDHVRMLGPDGVVNHQVNGDFSRIFESVSNKQDPWPADYAAHYVDALKALGKAVERAGFEPWMEGTDEAGNDPNSAAREINELKWAKETGYRTWCNLSPHLVEKVSSYLDGICYYVNFLGGPIGTAELLTQAKQNDQKVYLISSGSYVGQEADLLPNRHGVGLFFWKTGADGTAIWTYQRANGDPFNDFDSSFKDYCLVFPPREPGQAPVPTLGWEGVREGWRDYQYVYTLEQAVKNAQSQGRSREVAVGQAVLDFIRHEVPWFDQVENTGYDNASADSLRWLAAWAIMQVNQIDGGQDNQNAPAITSAMTAGIVTLKAAISTQDQSDDKIIVTPAIDSNTAELSFDGNLNDAQWAAAAHIDKFELHSAKDAGELQQTQVRFLHDKQYLYIGIRSYESNMSTLRTTATGHDGNVFGDDSIEIFLDTGHDHFNFYQLAFNAAGVQFDMRCAGANDFGQSVYGAAYDRKKIRDQDWNGKWDVKTTKHATYWEAEVRIPFATVGRINDLWGIHIGRNRHAGPSQTTTLRAFGYFHQPEKFTHLLLSGAREGKQQLTKLTLPDLHWGTDNLQLYWTGQGDFKANTNVSYITTSKSPNTEGPIDFPGTVLKNVANLPYTLGDMEDKNAGVIQWQIDNASGAAAWRIGVPFDLPPAMKVRDGKWVRLTGEQAMPFVLDLKLSPLAHKALTLQVLLADAKGNVLGSVSVDQPAETYHATLQLSTLPAALYSLKISLVDESGKVVLNKEQPIMIVPGYVADEIAAH